MLPTNMGLALGVLSVFITAGVFVGQARLRAGASVKEAAKEGAAVALFLLASMANLDGCATGNGRAAIHEQYEVETQTLAGNRVASGSSSLGGAIRQDRVRSPDGAAAVERCISIQQRYMRWLAENGLTGSSGFGPWVAQNAITVPDRCIDHVTSGTPMSWGGGGTIGTRTWIR